MKSRAKQTKDGLTLVELVIVVAVIAILVLVSIVAYNGIQQRTQDGKTRAVAQQIVKAIQVWGVNSDTELSIGGWGSTSYTNGACVGGSGGWFAKGIYSCTMEDVLVGADAIPSDLVYSVPSVNKNYGSTPPPYTNFMLYRCGSNEKWVFLYALHTDDEEEIATIKESCTGSPTGSFGAIDNYGMSGGIVFSPQTV